MSQPVYIDINCDMGESYGRWTLGHDEEVIRTSPRPILRAASMGATRT